MSWDKETIHRRQFLKAMARNGAELGLAVGSGGVLVTWLLSQEGKRGDFTPEQSKAVELFNSTDDGNFVHDIIAQGDKQDDKIIKAKLRNKPETPGDKDDLSYGKVVGVLEPNTVIDKALVVLGNDPKVPFDKNAKDLWYAFFNPNNNKQIVFAHDSVFAPTIDKLKVQAFDLTK